MLSLSCLGTILTGWFLSCGATELTPVEEPPVDTSEPRFATLQVGSRTLTNVTIASQSKEDIYLRHDGGLVGVRIDDLDEATRVRLGCPAPGNYGSAGSRLLEMVAEISAPPPQTEPAPEAAKPGVLRLDPEWLMGFGSTVLAVSAGVVLILHLVFSAMFRLICIKAQAPPGLLIWIPGLQIFPLLRAAKMSWAWPFAVGLLSIAGALLLGSSPDLAIVVSGLSSLVGLVLGIVWCFKICLARGKSPALALMLLLPGLNVLGVVYLAASE